MFPILIVLFGCAGIVRDQLYNPESTTYDRNFNGDPPIKVLSSTADGLRLRGLWWSASRPDAPVLIFFHGRSGNQDEAAQYAEHLRSTGANVLIASYRGYGGNPGKPTEANLLIDAKAFLALARNRLPHARIFLVGHSLGSAVAINLASSEQRSGSPIDGLFTIGAFTNLKKTAPAIVSSFLPDAYENEKKIATIAAPIVLIHARDDSVVPVSQARQLLAAAPGKSLLIVLSTGDHRPDMGLVSQIVQLQMDSGVKTLDTLVELAKPRGIAIFRKDTK
jgi:alpha-beta hydrolase superfamily lysophospholipase